MWMILLRPTSCLWACIYISLAYERMGMFCSVEHCVSSAFFLYMIQAIHSLQYRQMRRKEQDRLARMDADYQKRKELVEFNARREERLKAAEERTAKKRLKRQKKKQRKKGRKVKVAQGEDDDNNNHKEEPSSEEDSGDDSESQRC